jgi:hypothetical protein
MPYNPKSTVFRDQQKHSKSLKTELVAYSLLLAGRPSDLYAASKQDRFRATVLGFDPTVVADLLRQAGVVVPNQEVETLGAFDDCRDPKTGELVQWAVDLVTKANAYSEVTPSGTGMRVIGFTEGDRVHTDRKMPTGKRRHSFSPTLAPGGGGVAVRNKLFLG